MKNFRVLNCLYDSVSIMLRKNVEKRQMFKQLDGVFLAVDEICDGGIIMEVEPQVPFNTKLHFFLYLLKRSFLFYFDFQAVIEKVAIKNDDIPLTEQTVAQVFQSAKEQIKWSLLK